MNPLDDKNRLFRRLLPTLAVCSLAPLSVFAQTAAAPDAKMDEPVNLSPFAVTAPNETGYGTSSSLGATRINVPLIDVPQFVTVINAQFMADVGAITLEGATKYVSGVEGAGSPNSGSVILRGWQVGVLNSTRDGLQDPNIFTNLAGGTLEMSLVDRIEVLKGPSGTLYGSHVAGGIVNTVTKKPLDYAQTTVTLTVGSFNLYRLDFDTTGPIDTAKKFLYRLIFTEQKADDYQGVIDHHTVLSPSFSWLMGPESKATVSYIYSRPRVPGNPYEWFMDKDHNISYFIPRDQLVPDRDSLRTSVENEVDFDFTHGVTLGDTRWDTRLKIRYSNDSQHWWVSTFAAANYQFVNAAGQVIGNITNMDFSTPGWTDIIITRTGQDRWEVLRQGDINYDITGKFNLGPSSHTALIYANDIIHEDHYHTLLWNLTPQDVFHPVYYGDNTAAQESNFHVGSDNNTDYNAFGAGAQDNISFLHDHVIFVAGARYDWLDQIIYNNVASTNAQNYRDNWSDRFGLVAKPLDGVAVFYNYADTFTPLTGVNLFTGLPYLNETSITNEGGIKLDLMQNKLTLTASDYILKFNNQPITIGLVQQANGNLVNETVQEGISWARGWDSDLTWTPTKNISFLGGFGNVNSKTVTGAHQRGVPIGFTYRMWGKYEFTEGALKGLSAGLGFSHTARKDVDGSGVAWLPAYNNLDGMIAYRWGHWNLQGNLYNITNVKYASYSVATYIIYAGDPINGRVSLGYKF